MHHRARNIAGLRVGYLTALRYSRSNGRKSLWAISCDCGNQIEKDASEFMKLLKRGVKASCGCKRGASIRAAITTHGMSKHKAFAVWRSMLDRCRLPTHQAWKNYGARGISVCESWQEFSNFWADMGPTYAEGLTLDRVDNDGNYTPENCRWTTRKQQARNTRLNTMLDTPWGRMTVAEAAERSGLNYTTLLYRVEQGVAAPHLFSAPDTSRKFSTL